MHRMLRNTILSLCQTLFGWHGHSSASDTPMDLLRKSKLDSALVEICSSRVLISLRHCACGAVDDDPVAGWCLFLEIHHWKAWGLRFEAVQVWSISFHWSHVLLYMSTILFWSRDIAKIDRVGMKLCKLGVGLEQDIMLQVSSEYRWNITVILGCSSWSRLV